MSPKINCNGAYLIFKVTKQLETRGVLCYDSAIVNEINKLTVSELNNLVTFGDIPRWIAERKKVGGE